MELFLTSNIGGIKKENGVRIAEKFSDENNFLKELKSSLLSKNKFVLVASNPSAVEQNTKFLELDIEALNLTGFKFDKYVVLDDRNKNDIADIIDGSSLIFLCGGNTYIQNMFFNEINLKKYINENIEASIVGISAGAINAADIVFNSPEDEEDLEKPYILHGLQLTNINIEPHFDIKNDNHIQIQSIIKESYNRIIYGLPDGSYIKNNMVYGECYKIQDGKIELICENNNKFKL